MIKLSFMITFLVILFCIGFVNCRPNLNPMEEIKPIEPDLIDARRVLPRNILKEINWDNLQKFLRFVFDNFKEWLKNKTVSLLFKNIAANLN